MDDQLQLHKVSTHIGAEVSGIDFSVPLKSELELALKNALSRYGVLFIRDQALEAEQLLSLAKIFGEPLPNSHPKFSSIDGYPEIAVVVNDQDNPPDINVWHTDTTFMSVPAGVCVLKCVECPSEGGDTLWSSMYAALDALSPSMLDFLSGLEAEHRLPLDNVPAELVHSIGDREILANHPVLRWIPELKRPSLFVNRVYAKRLLGLHKIESQGLLDMLFTLSESPDFQIRYRWRKNSIAIWDNRITQHFAAADYFPERRVMHRVALVGEKPILYRPH